MTFSDEMKAEREIAIPVRDSLVLIKETVLAYQGDNSELQKLNLKAQDLADEADGRGGSFPMEKLMSRARKIKAKSYNPDVALFFDGLHGEMNIVKEGIQKIVERNIGLVGHLINKFEKHETYSREDRVQDGNAGLLKAAYRFEPNRNIKFSTYACWWIKQEARLGFMSMAKTIRWPSNVYQAMGKGENTFISAMGKNGDVVFAATSCEPISIDSPWGVNNTEPLINCLKAPLAIPVEDLVDNREVSSIISDSIDSLLTKREAQVIRARFGINQKSDHILADIGKDIGVSPERVRHIQNGAILKLKGCMNLEKLQGHFA